MSRKLASIQVITAIDPIPGADRIEVASILGWKVVVKKGEFAVGDHCVYVEIDSILPEKPEFEFLRERNFRVKTVKLRKQLSQGICFPTSVLPSGKYYAIDQDVTEALGVKKYELPDFMGVPNRLKGYASKPFPGFIMKTDEPRVQSNPRIIEEIKGKRVYITQKQDGTSFTAYYDIRNKHYGVCSRNYELYDPSKDRRTWWQKIQDWYRQLTLQKPRWWKNIKDSYWDMSNELGLEQRLTEYCTRNNVSIAVQGELCGEGVQDNKMGLKGRKLYLFNIWNISEQRYYNITDSLCIAKELGLEWVPILSMNVEFNYYFVEQLLQLAEGNYDNGTPQEGIVIRPMEESKSVVLGGDRMSFKVINNKFLLEYGDR